MRPEVHVGQVHASQRMRRVCVLSLIALHFVTAIRRKGFVGTYHAAPGVVADGHNTSAYDAGEWGIVSPVNAANDGGMSLKDDIFFHCKKADVNALYGMLIAHSEGGTFNNTNDTDLWNPLPTARPDRGQKLPPRGVAGLLQAVAPTLTPNPNSKP